MKKFYAALLSLTLGAALTPLKAADSTPQKKTLGKSSGSAAALSPVASAKGEANPSVTTMEASPESKELMKKFQASWRDADEESKKWAKMVQEQEIDKEKRDKELTNEYLRQVKRRGEMDEQASKQSQAFYAREDEFFKKRAALLDAQKAQLDTEKLQVDKLDALLKLWDAQTKRYEELLAKTDRMSLLLQKWEDQARNYDAVLKRWQAAP